MGKIRNTLKKIFRFGPYIPLSNIFLNLGNRFFSDKCQENIHARRNKKIQSFLKPIIEQVSEDNQIADSPETESPIIWVCWLQGEKNMPEIAKVCLESIRKNSNGHEVVLLDNGNIKSYVQLPEVVTQLHAEGKIKHAHFADLIRIYLLAQRGGLWLDATMLVVKPIPKEIFNYPFYSIKTPEIGHFISKCRWAVFMLGCKPGNRILVKVARAFEIYLDRTDVFIDYFLFDQFIDMLYKSDTTIRQMIDNVPANNPEVHWLGDKLCEDYNEDDFNKVTSHTDMFKLSTRTYSTEQLNTNRNSYYSKLKRYFIG